MSTQQQRVKQLWKEFNRQLPERERVSQQQFQHVLDTLLKDKRVKHDIFQHTYPTQFYKHASASLETPTHRKDIKRSPPLLKSVRNTPNPSHPRQTFSLEQTFHRLIDNAVKHRQSMIHTPFLYARLEPSKTPYRLNDHDYQIIDITEIQTNPLYQRKGYFTRFLHALTSYCSQQQPPYIIRFTNVLGENLKEYISKRGAQFQPTDTRHKDFYYTPSLDALRTFIKHSSKSTNTSTIRR
jgi:hypothetical protein